MLGGELKRTIRKIKRELRRLVRAAAVVGWVAVLKCVFFSRDTIISVSIDDADVFVRARLKDLRVAIDNISNEYNFLTDYLPKDTDAVIVDAGGYIGTAALAIARKLPMARIISVEPSSENIAVLQRNIARNSRIDVRHAALVSGSRSSVTLKRRGREADGYSIVDAPGDCQNPVSLETVNTISISDLVSEFNQELVFLKLDIEGAERELFKNDAKILSDIPFVFVELHEKISQGCISEFQKFSEERTNIRMGDGEKYLSIKCS